MKRTLYLNENTKGIHVVVDGPSLLIKRPYLADRRVPLGYIGRMLVFGNVLVDSNALITLAQNNIPVFLISKWNCDLSVSLSVQQIIERKSLKVLNIIQNKTKRNLFIKWLKEKRISLKNEILKQFKASNKDYFEVITFFMRLKRKEFKTVYKINKLLIWSLIIEELVKKDFNIHYGILNSRGPFGLVRDYFYVMQHEVVHMALQFSKQRLLKFLDRESYKQAILSFNDVYELVEKFEGKQSFLKGIIDAISYNIVNLMSKKYEG